MAKTKRGQKEAAWSALFERLRERRDAIVEVTSRDTDIEPQHLEPAFERVLELVSHPVPGPDVIESWREEGVRLSRAGAPAELVLDGYLSLNWAIWEAVMNEADLPRETVLDFAHRLLRGLDDAIAAISEGYIRVELELTAAHSHRRRAVLEEMLVAPRATPQDRARINLRAERNGLAVGDTYRLILIQLPEQDEHEIEDVVEELERRIRIPISAQGRGVPGIRLPVVLDWRGRALVFTKGDWTGEKRLREAVLTISGGRCVAVDSGPIEGIEAVAEALTQADYSATVAASLGRRGWIGDPGELALETTFLLDARLVREVIHNELGPLLADPRMGEELIETLEVYLGSKQNIREAARRLHLAPRTVAYRLERIETLLGRDLDGETAVRLGAALLALRVSRQVGITIDGDASTG